MKVEKVTISLGRTVNRGNFENTRYDVSITATIPPGRVRHRRCRSR